MGCSRADDGMMTARNRQAPFRQSYADSAVNATCERRNAEFISARQQNKPIAKILLDNGATKV